MAKEDVYTEPLLAFPTTEGDDIHVEEPSLNNLLRPRSSHKWLLPLVLFGLLSSALNVYLLVASATRESFSEKHNVSAASTLMGPSAYTGLSLDTPTVHHHHTDYWSKNTTVSDALWDEIDTDPMVVALDHNFADTHGLPRSDRFPWDEQKGRYFIKVFHQLHCLKFIRRAFADYERGLTPSLDGRHVHHCLDSLRQDVQCIADDTPMPTGEDARAIGDEQTVMCRDYSKLVQWVYAPERNACHKALSDYRSITHSIERYAYCPKDSPYFPVMTRYFQQKGHLDPWG